MKMIKVLFLASEADPLVKVGGLGDVAGSLPGALQQLPIEKSKGVQVDIRVIIPFHGVIRKKVEHPEFLFEFDVPSKSGIVKARAYQAVINDVRIYLIAGEPIGDDAPVYSTDAALDGHKYIFFSKSILPFIERLGWIPDILHANDWHTAIAVYQLKAARSSDPHFQNIKTILTIHNLPFMGAGTEEAFDEYAIQPSKYSLVPWWGKKFPLCLGLQTADRITTVSQTYAQEIMTPEYGCGLEKLLQTRKKVVSGIVNGLDEAAWDPFVDPKIPVNFDASTLEKRLQNKSALQQEFGLPQQPNTPLFVLVSRMDQQKGVDLAVEGLEMAAKRKWQAILLGTGNPQLEDACRKLEKKHPNRIKAAIRFDAALSRRMYAGGDVLLMPSRYEPCGLAQMMAMRYGCIPLARATGGLQDTIVDINQNADAGTGFLFKPATADAFAETVDRALDLYPQKKAWQAMQLRGMAQNFSWQNSALQYLDLYLNLLN